MQERIRELIRIWNEAIHERRVPTGILAPDFVMKNVATAVTTKTYEGAAGVEEWLDDFSGHFSEWTYRSEVVAITDELAVGRITMTGRGRASDAPLDLTHYGVMWIRDGKLARALGFGTKREALQAAGLEA